jgi:hypothetical protein
MFLPKFLRLLASITIEAAYNLCCLLFSLLPGRRGLLQSKMKAAMCKVRNGPPCVILALLLLLGAGCSSCPPGKSLTAELEISFFLLRETTDPLEELSRDFTTIFGPEWGEFMDTVCRLSQ